MTSDFVTYHRNQKDNYILDVYLHLDGKTEKLDHATSKSLDKHVCKPAHFDT